MKRQVLFIGYDRSIQEEIREFLKERGGQAWFTETMDRSVPFLRDHPVDTVVLSMHSMRDAAILNYVSQNYPAIQVIVSASPEYEEIITVLSRRNFRLLQDPIRLKELNELMD